MADNRIEVVLQARDEASAKLAAATKKLQDLDEATRKAARATEDAAKSSQTFGTAIGGSTLLLGGYTAAAAVAGQAARAWIATTNAATLEQTKFNQAVLAFDTGYMRGQLKQAAEEIENNQRQLQTWSGYMAGWWGKFKEDHGLAIAATDTHARAIKALAEALPLEQAEKYSKVLQELSRSQQAMAALDAQRATSIGSLQNYLAAQDAVTEAIKREANEERRQIALQAERRSGEAIRRKSLDVEGPDIKRDLDAALAVADAREAARLRAVQQAAMVGTQQLRIRESLYARNQAATVGDLATGDEGGIFFGPAAQNSVRQLLQEIEQKATERLLVLIRNEGQVLGEHAVSDYADPVFSPKAAAESKQLGVQLDQQALELEARKAEIAAQSIGLGQAEVARLQIISVEMRLQASLQDESLTRSQKALALFEAQAAQQGILRREAERIQAIPGLDLGLREAEENFGAMGLRMQSLAHSMAQGMSGAFSDGFFNVLTGQFKALPDVAKQMTNAMVRAVTDELGKLVTSPILGSIRNLLGGGAFGARPFR